jgi:hypothetical protein
MPPRRNPHETHRDRKADLCGTLRVDLDATCPSGVAFHRRLEGCDRGFGALGRNPHETHRDRKADLCGTLRVDLDATCPPRDGFC